MAQRTAAKTPITGPLKDSDRDATGKALQATLVDLVDLHLTAKQAHWNVVGEFFRDVHLHLDELVSTARSLADDVAERAATIGYPPDGRSATLAETSGVTRFESGWRTTREVKETVVRILADLISRLRPRIEETDKTDQVTQDLLISVAQQLEKAHWMWEAKLAD
ncbi:Dps family protein [Bounagaea algeriensis]